MKATYMCSHKTILNDIDGYVKFLKKESITDLYLNFTRAEKYREAYKPLVSELQSNGISVHALGGTPDWALDNSGVQSFIDALNAYNTNATPLETISRIHFDIEPHTLADWNINHDTYIEAWKGVIEFYISYAKMPVSVAIPFWYAKNFPELYEFLIKKHEHVTIMAYRDTFEGGNGFDSIFRPNLEAAYELKLPNKVVGAVELVNTPEGPNLTFYDDGLDVMNEMLDRVRWEYFGEPSFKGVAIHHLELWRQMKEEGK